MVRSVYAVSGWLPDLFSEIMPYERRKPSYGSNDVAEEYGFVSASVYICLLQRLWRQVLHRLAGDPAGPLGAEDCWQRPPDSQDDASGAGLRPGGMG